MSAMGPVFPIENGDLKNSTFLLKFCPMEPTASPQQSGAGAEAALGSTAIYGSRGFSAGVSARLRNQSSRSRCPRRSVST